MPIRHSKPRFFYLFPLKTLYFEMSFLHFKTTNNQKHENKPFLPDITCHCVTQTSIGTVFAVYNCKKEYFT